MAITSITPTKIKRVNQAYELEALVALGLLASTDAAYIATSGTYGAKLPYEKKMGKYVLLIENTSTASASVYVEANDHEFFNKEHLVVPVDSGATVALNIDTGRHLRLNGADKGHVYVASAAATVKVALIELP